MIWFGHAIGPLGWFVMLACMVLFVVLILAVVSVVSRLTNHAPKARSDAALDILRERFARGEITEPEFEAAKRTLGL